MPDQDTIDSFAARALEAMDEWIADNLGVIFTEPNHVDPDEDASDEAYERLESAVYEAIVKALTEEAPLDLP